MRRSNSSGWPVSSACTGASKPSACADFGTSCTWPSVIMMTPASRSGGVLASALLRSAKRLVPEADSPVGLGGADPAHLQIVEAAELGLQLAPDRRRLLGPAGDGLAQLSSTTTMAMLARLSRSSCRSVGLASAQQQRRQRQRAQQGAAAAPHQQQRHQHGRQHRAGPEHGARHHRREVDRPVAHCTPSLFPSPACGERVRGGGDCRTSERVRPSPCPSPQGGSGTMRDRVSAPNRHCPSLSSRAGTCTWSAL